MTCYGLTQTVAPASEPLTVSDAALHLRVDEEDERDLIEAMIRAAREYSETWTRRQLVTATYQMTLDGFPSWTMELPRAPLSSVTSIAYVDTAGTSQTLDASKYDVDTTTLVGRVQPAHGQYWPATRSPQMQAVTVTYIAGYGTTPTDVPESIRHAMRLLIGHWFENRENEVVGTISQPLAFTVKALLSSEQVPMLS